jgi:GMP synthase-like glutamine amidotransferase
MRIHSLLHAKHEGIGAIVQWIEHHGYSYDSTNLYLGENLPAPDDFDMLIVMGGPMSINDSERYEWLTSEITFIKDVIKQGKYVIGICLGAQLIAAALGAKISACEYKEIGWFPVKKAMWLAHPVADFLPFYYTTFHWHGETFDLPDGAKRIMTSEVCENQAFIFSNNVAAFQYHMEVTPEIIEEFVMKGEEELVKDKYIQTPVEIMAMTYQTHENNLYLFRVLDYFAYMFNKNSGNN